MVQLTTDPRWKRIYDTCFEYYNDPKGDISLKELLEEDRVECLEDKMSEYFKILELDTSEVFWICCYSGGDILITHDLRDIE